MICSDGKLTDVDDELQVFLSVIDREVTAKIGNMRHAVTEGDKADQRQMGPHTVSAAEMLRRELTESKAPEVRREGVYRKTSDVYSYGLLLWSIIEREDISDQVIFLFLHCEKCPKYPCRPDIVCLQESRQRS